MNQFIAGDRVKRIRGHYAGMTPGHEDVVVGYIKPDGSSRRVKSGVLLQNFGAGHAAYNLELVERQPIGDPDDSKVEAVEHPKHYNLHPSGVECITIARHHEFNIGNVFKYLWRIGLKGSDAGSKESRLEEIDKAIFYLKDERDRVAAEA